MLRARFAKHFPDLRHDNILFAESGRPGGRKRAALAGQKLPCSGMCIRKTGDWGWMKQACCLTGWRDGPQHRACYYCLANGDDLPWTDPSMQAKWRRTMFTLMSSFFMAAFASGQVCVERLSGIFGFPGFHILMCDIDWMHTGDLGVLTRTIR